MTTTEPPPTATSTEKSAGEPRLEFDEDPRIRERRIEVKRAADRKRVRIFAIVAGVFVCLGFAYLVVNSSALDVDHVQIGGATHADPDAIRAAAGDLIGDPILLVDTDGIVERVERVPWVADARLVRHLPGTLRIVVTEHDSVAYVRRANGKAALLSKDGRVVADVDVPPPGVVEILGLRRPPRVGGIVSPPDAPGILTQLPAELSERVTAIDLSGPGAALDLATGGEVRFGTLDDVDTKAAATLTVLAQLGNEPFVYIDVRVPQTPAVR